MMQSMNSNIIYYVYCQWYGNNNYILNYEACLINVSEVYGTDI